MSRTRDRTARAVGGTEFPYRRAARLPYAGPTLYWFSLQPPKVDGEDTHASEPTVRQRLSQHWESCSRARKARREAVCGIPPPEAWSRESAAVAGYNDCRSSGTPGGSNDLTRACARPASTSRRRAETYGAMRLRRRAGGECLERRRTGDRAGADRWELRTGYLRSTANKDYLRTCSRHCAGSVQRKRGEVACVRVGKALPRMTARWNPTSSGEQEHFDRIRRQFVRSYPEPDLA